MASRNSNKNGRTDRDGIRVVLYLRMSSAKQDKSIDAQRDELLALAQHNGYEVVHEYVDEAISGDSTEKRVEFLRLRSDAASGAFDRILVWDQDRLSRNDPLELGFWLKPIRDAGIVVETPQGVVDWETLGGRLIYLISQEMKHDYLLSLSRNVVRGQRDAARNGKRRGTGGGGPTLDGYIRHADGSVEVDQARSEIVRSIFERYLDPSGSLRSVTTGLNLAGITTQTGGKWTVGRIRKTLTNEKYVGTFVRFRWSGGKYYGLNEDQEIVARSKGEKKTERDQPLISIPDNHPAIISQEVFDQAQAKITTNRTETTRKDARVFPFAGLLRCSDCGGVMGGRGSRYICNTYHRNGRGGCNPNQISENKLLPAVVKLLQREYCGPDRIEDLRRALQDELAAETTVKPVDQRRLQKQIETLDRQLDQAAERVLVAPAALVDRLTNKLGELQESRDRLQAELDAGDVDQEQLEPLTEEIVESAIEALQRFSERLTDAKPEDLRELISGFVIRIELHFDHPATEPGKRSSHVFTEGRIVTHMFPVSGIDRRTAYQM